MKHVPAEEGGASPVPDQTREAWLARRREREARIFQGPRMGVFLLIHHGVMLTLRAGLRLTGLMERGLRNARTPVLRHLSLEVAGLPEPFAGYRILHLTDLHLPVIPHATERILELTRHEAVDLVVLTGDMGHWLHPLPESSLALLGRLCATLTPADGFLAVLGNHDHSTMVAPMEALGIRVLINEAFTVRRGQEALRFTGIDDVHFFPSPQGMACLAAPVEGCAVALVHSPEVAGTAADAGYGLYLTGHTHGGQIRLPGLPPLWTALKSHGGLAHGVWRLGAMTGYTSAGVGSSHPPVRFNCPPEAVILTLRTPQGDAT